MDEEIIIRAKWVMDDARTLAQAREKLLDYAGYLRSLEMEGYELTQPVADDYGFVTKGGKTVTDSFHLGLDDGYSNGIRGEAWQPKGWLEPPDDPEQYALGYDKGYRQGAQEKES